MTAELYTVEFPPAMRGAEKVLRITNTATRQAKHVVGPKVARVLVALIEDPTNENLKSIFEGC